MKWFTLFFLLSTIPLAAQQQVVPQDFNSKQARLFQKMTQAVSAPCCQNGIPVAYHDSGMAEYVRGEVIQWIRAGEGEAQIMSKLEAMRLGPNRDMPLIFTVPDKKLVSILTWLVAPIVAGLGFLIIFLVVLRKDNVRTNLSDDELVSKYRDHIMQQLGREEKPQKA